MALMIGFGIRSHSNAVNTYQIKEDRWIERWTRLKDPFLFHRNLVHTQRNMAFLICIRYVSFYLVTFRKTGQNTLYRRNEHWPPVHFHLNEWNRAAGKINLRLSPNFACNWRVYSMNIYMAYILDTLNIYILKYL